MIIDVRRLFGVIAVLFLALLISGAVFVYRASQELRVKRMELDFLPGDEVFIRMNGQRAVVVSTNNGTEICTIWESVVSTQLVSPMILKRYERRD